MQSSQSNVQNVEETMVQDKGITKADSSTQKDENLKMVILREQCLPEVCEIVDTHQNEESNDTGSVTTHYILLNESRKKCMNKMRKYIFGSEEEQTASEQDLSNRIVANLIDEIKEITKSKKRPQRLDMLLALTYNLFKYQFWIDQCDQYQGKKNKLQESLAHLGIAWKKVLANKNEDIQIDGEVYIYTHIYTCIQIY